jgi:hypothetical protein
MYYFVESIEGTVFLSGLMDTLGGAATHYGQSVEGGVKPENNNMFRDFYIGRYRIS